MTREEAIKVIHKMLAYTDLSVRANLTADMIDACRLAIKALEQETVSKESYDHEYFLRKKFEIKIAKLEHDKNVVLDKIRAEIIQSIQNGTLKIESGNEELFRIIDKYKAESEVEDGND